MSYSSAGDSAQHRQRDPPVRQHGVRLHLGCSHSAFPLDDKHCAAPASTITSTRASTCTRASRRCRRNASRSATNLRVDNTRARSLFDATFQPGDWFVFGAETTGLPDAVRAWFKRAGPAVADGAGSRSLNLFQRVAVVVYEAWRQARFDAGS